MGNGTLIALVNSARAGTSANKLYTAGQIRCSVKILEQILNTASVNPHLKFTC